MILVTGGTGNIGSHTVVELMAAGRDVLIIDNLYNSKASVLDRIERIVGWQPGFAQSDIRDRPALRKLFAVHRFDAVIHFAGLKTVGESVEKPLAQYDNNVSGSVALFECMAAARIARCKTAGSHPHPKLAPLTAARPRRRNPARSRSDAPARTWNARPRKSASAAASHWVVGRKSMFTAVEPSREQGSSAP